MRIGLYEKPLSMNPVRDGSLLTPALSSTSMWKRGRGNLTRRFVDSMRELVWEVLSGSVPTSRGEREEA
jgi:hypothetical protein